MPWFGGQRQTCLACGQTYSTSMSSCPVCLVPQGQTSLPPVSQGGPVQIMRTYTGNHATQAFQREAFLLARAGWIITSQVASGYNAFKIGKRPPTLISVTYGRAPGAR